MKTEKKTVETIGLTAGTKYVISATPFNKLLDGDGNLTGIVYGKETFGEVLTLNETAESKDHTCSGSEGLSG